MAVETKRPPVARHAARAAAALAILAIAVALVRGAAEVLPLGVVLVPALLLTVLVPGFAAARVLRVDEALDALTVAVAALPLGCGAWALALAAAMAAHLPLTAAAVTVGAASAIALSLRPAPHGTPAGRWPAAIAAGSGLALALAASRYETALHGDALFHAGRLRKLIDLPHLSLSGLSSVWHGSPHAGYVVPAWHAIEAVAVRMTGADPSAAYSSLAPACAVLLPAAAFALGTVAAGRAVGTAVAVLAMWDALARESLETIQQPPGFTFYVLVPAVLALMLAASRSGFDRRLARGVLLSVVAVAVIHATYAVLPLACLAALVLVHRAGIRLLTACLVATATVFGVIWALALRGGTHQPQPPVLGRVFVKHGGDPVVAQAHWIFDQRPEIALGVLAVVPLLLLYRQRHAVAAAVMAGALTLCSLPGVPTLLSGVFGVGQVKRFGRSGLPWALTAGIALVELAAIAGRRAALATAAAVAVASLIYEAVVPEGAVLTAVVTAAAVAAAAVVVAFAVRPRPVRLNAAAGAGPATAGLLALALVAGSVRADHSLVAHDLRHGLAVPDTLPQAPGAVIAYLRRHDAPPFPVVLAESYIGYQLAGQADVYPVAVPLERARGEPRNAPAARRRAVNIVLAPGVSDRFRARVFDRYHVTYVVVNSGTTPRAKEALSADPGLTTVLTSGDWTVFRVRTS